MNATLFTSHNLSRSDISVRYVFQKMFSPKGTLVAVECLSRFDRLAISPENFFRYANTGLRESIFMDALITFLSRNHHNVIIEGVESEAHKKWLQGMEWFAIQGHYWQEVSIEQLVQEKIAV